MAPSSGSSAQATSYLINHIVLPPKLPHKDDYDQAHERHLIDTTMQALQDFKARVSLDHANIVASAVSAIKNLRSIRDSTGDINEVQLGTILQKAVNGGQVDMIPLEFKAQNAAVIITKDSDSIVFEAFELSPTNEAAMGAKGRLIRTFPALASKIPIRDVQKTGLVESLARTISKLSTQSAPGMQPQVRKNGKDLGERRDTTKPAMVTDYLVNLVAALGATAEVSRITKYTREEVLWKDCLHPWRRSALWLLIRVSLQLLFTRKAANMSATDGLYKAFMIQLLSRVLGMATYHWEELGSEASYAISAKLCRRLRKLEHVGPFGCLQPDWINHIRSSTSEAHSIMNKHWKGLADGGKASASSISLANLRPQQDLDMQLPELDTFISHIKGRQTARPSVNFTPTSRFPTFNASQIPDYFNASGEYKFFGLAAAEKWVEQYLQAWLASNCHQPNTCEQLRCMMKDYHQLASSTYASDPIRMSVMYLTLLELWVACDTSAYSIYPLLQGYSPEIDLRDFQSLILPLKSQMTRLHQVERYVDAREAMATKNGPSIYRDFGHPSSFAVRFFDQSSELQLLKAQVERDATQKKEKKCQELADLKRQYNDLMARYDNTSCDYHEVVTDADLGYTEMQHNGSCTRCGFEKKANRLDIGIYEWPLSSNPSVAKATIFEVNAPQAFSDWRDASTYIILDVLEFFYVNALAPQCSYMLDQHHELSHLLSGEYYRRRILPLSSTKSHTVTHRKRQKSIPLLGNDDVCLENALQYKYYDKSRRFWCAKAQSAEAMAKNCSYTMPHRSEALQRFMHKPPSAPDGVAPNEVLASLADCPPHFSIDEFKAFGAVPLGQNIMYSNILAQLAIPIVDFAKPEVQAMIAQVIHQAGPVLDGCTERVGHRILTDGKFGHAMLDQLEVALGRVLKNWESWRAMASFILLSQRVLSLTTTPDIRTRSLNFLAKARSICMEWLMRLKKRVSSSTDDEQRTELCSRATEVAIVCTSTFDVEKPFICQILRQKSAVSALVQSTIVVQENSACVRSEHESLHRSHLQSYRSMMYRVLPELREHILDDNVGLNKAILANWAAFQPAFGARWTGLSQPQDHWLTIASGTLQVHFNLLTAELLVNGSPLARLPNDYMQHSMYTTLFHRSALEVVPANDPGMTFSAKSTYSDYRLAFGMLGQDMLVVAIKDNIKLDLLPSRLFRDRLPARFTDEFVHWYDHKTNEVVFRPRNNPWSTSEDEWRLKRQKSAWRMVRGNKVLVNTASSSARTVSQVFSPLENSHHVHIILDTDSATINIELPRLQLDFYLEQHDHRFFSRAYRGMVVDENQNIGTLVGLTSKLVLKHAHNVQEQRMLLIPAANKYCARHVTYAKVPNVHHVSVSIHNDGPTRVYAYSVDTILGRVLDSGDLQSKLFICFLHALTSHCLPDPLTGHTGTETALTILQSAAVRSFESLTTENVDLLIRIASLSPLRVFYPLHLKSMQQIDWDGNLPTFSQHPDFRASAQVIIQQGQQMQLFTPDNILDVSKFQSSNPHLESRDAIRSSTFRTCGFGAEQFTTCKDVGYVGRDTHTTVSRGVYAYKAAKLVVRDQAALCVFVGNLKHDLRKAYFDEGVITGSKGTFDLSRLRYDSKWLQEQSTFLRDEWCTLHSSLPAAMGSCNPFDIAAWLSAMAYSSSADMTAIQTLAAFYRMQDLSSQQPPLAAQFDLSKGDQFNPLDIRTLATTAAKSFSGSSESMIPKQGAESNKKHSKRIRNLFHGRQNLAISAMTAALQSQWPCMNPAAPIAADIHQYINPSSVMPAISAKFKAWLDNQRFGEYLDRLAAALTRKIVLKIALPSYVTYPQFDKIMLEAKLRHYSTKRLFDVAPDTITCSDVVAPLEPSFPPRHGIEGQEASRMQSRLESFCQILHSYANSKCETNYVQNLRDSCASLKDQEVDVQMPDVSAFSNVQLVLSEYLAACKEYLAYLNRALTQAVITNGSLSDHMDVRTQHSPRISPTLWLAQLHCDNFNALSEHWKSVIIEYGLAITQVHRAQRLLAVSNKPVDLAEELRHVGHSNWNPAEFPEMLLLEAESGITIRREQEFIASQMRNPEDGKNIVLQLLMGGGKSSTIVPVLAINFTNKCELVRVIVAKPQSKQMQQILVAKLGGLLNRRIYHMPFSRNLRLTESDAITLRQIYEDCIEKRGVLLIQPEHILSFKLMGVESLLIQQPSTAARLLDTQAFFDKVSRDIVDESDMNFSVKFELIYTMGSQQSIEFAPDRWSIIEDILGFLPRFAAEVKQEHPHSVEIEHGGGVLGKYPRIRLLHPDAADRVLHLLATHIVEYGVTGLPVRNQDSAIQVAVFRYITIADLSDEDIKAVEASDFWTESTQSLLLLVRGLIACGVLRFALSTKRWRVNFGQDASRTPKTSLAVPYRSKDAPSPRSEFSHPDVVILLTQLSYYYGGLSDEEMFDSFVHLLKSDQASIHYDEWVSTAAPSLPPAYHNLSGVSIRDRHQCIFEIFPHLRHSKKAIDYYLSRLVFPKEMKQFPEKLSGSGWDIGAVKTHPTTGFSGTNDTLHLLPLSVHHLDLPSQSHTNALVLGYLLQDETSVQLLPSRTSGSDAEHLINFIEDLDEEVRVMLDCGAAILEQNNVQVAQTWLKSCKSADVEAVVFFSDEELSVLDRSGRIEAFQTSPFAKQLDRCLVYLDESHSRGTDLKLSRTYRAAVTLGSHLCKDTLTQACMRMRLLGRGQAITFIVPEEITTKIRERTGKNRSDPIEVADVLCWSIGETWDDLKRSMPLWAVQGHRYETHKQLLHGAATTLSEANQFLEEEAQSLEHRYRPLTQGSRGIGLTKDWDLTNENIRKVIQRCQDFGATRFGSAALSEEQERELAPEVEEERQIERPPRMKAEAHVLHSDLERLAHNGVLPHASEAWEQAFTSLGSTSAGALFNLGNFPPDLLCTVDFVRTVKPPGGIARGAFVSDPFQRPVQWVMSVRGPDGYSVRKLLILSPFEANKLLGSVASTKKVTLHMFAPRSNASFVSLDKLELFNVGRTFNAQSVPRSLTAQLNLFSGSLYLRSFREYSELCDFLGLLQGKAKQGQRVSLDGFITPPGGKWGLTRSPVSFLRTLLMKIRREGEGVEKTHLGKMLGGARLEEADFKPDA